jgi:hypothetical protein
VIRVLYSADYVAAAHAFPTTQQREDLVFSWCERMRIPIAFVLAGGYTGASLTQPELVELHRLTIERAAGPQS